MTDSIILTVDQGVATVSLNRPDKHNAFDDQIIVQLTEAFLLVENDDSVRVMILAANGKNFCAGGDLNWMKRIAAYSHTENLADATALATMLRTLNSLSKPTIARVQGAAYGGAVGLVSCCDMAVGAGNSRFCLSEVKIGLIPATISPYVIAAIGEKASRRYFLTAEVFTGLQARQMNLLSEVCDESELDVKVRELVDSILANGPMAVREAKQLIFEVDNRSVDDQLVAQTSARIAAIRGSEEGQEGLSAFLEKRAPSWKGSHQSDPE